VPERKQLYLNTGKDLKKRCNLVFDSLFASILILDYKLPMLTLRNISATIGEKTILHSISHTFEEGKTYGLIGPNGAGKSTICRVIQGDGELNIAGSIELNHCDISHATLQERFIQGVFVSYQNPTEIPGVTISNLLLKGLNNKLSAVKQPELSSSEFLVLAKSVISTYNLPEKIYTWKVNEGLSGGQKKLLEIFQLLVCGSSVIVLDEIDSGLDIDSNKLILEIIKKLQQDQSKLLIIISHYPQFLQELTPDEIIVLKDGRIVETGNKELLTNITDHGYTGFSN
jgi:Fe-S cluster assembly ATP-binding protein